MTKLTEKDFLFEAESDVAKIRCNDAILEYKQLQKKELEASESIALTGIVNFSKQLLEKSDYKYVPETVSDVTYEGMFENEYFQQVGKVYIYAKQALEMGVHSSFLEEFGQEVCLRIAAIEAEIFGYIKEKELEKARNYFSAQKEKKTSDGNKGGTTSTRISHAIFKVAHDQYLVRIERGEPFSSARECFDHLSDYFQGRPTISLDGNDEEMFHKFNIPFASEKHGDYGLYVDDASICQEAPNFKEGKVKFDGFSKSYWKKLKNNDINFRK